MQQTIDLEQLCAERGLRITEQRRIIARVLSESQDHPDVEQLHRRASRIDPKISIATVYRTVRLFEEAGILDRHDFGDGRARYEAADATHHDHLIDVETGQVIEVVDALGVLARHGAGVGEQLLGLALDPAWPDDASVFVHYTDARGRTVLSRFTMASRRPMTA